MKILSSSTEVGQSPQRAAGVGRRIGWGVYLIGAVSVLILWFVVGSVFLSYLFGGWIMVGALLLWYVEDPAE